MQSIDTNSNQTEAKTASTAPQASPEDRSIFVAYATLGISVLSSANRDPIARLHAYQAAIYVLAALAVHAVFTVFGDALSPLRLIYDLAAAGFYGYMVWAAWQGKPMILPVIGSIARKQATTTTNDNSTVQ